MIPNKEDILKPYLVNGNGYKATTENYALKAMEEYAKEFENVTAHNMLVQIQSILNANLHGGYYVMEPTPIYQKYINEIIKETKEYAKKYAKSMAIGFLSWSAHRFAYVGDGKYSPKAHAGEMPKYTYDQLYDLYIQSLNNR